MRSISWVLVAAVLFSACAMKPPTRTIVAKFDPAEMAGCDETGTGTITGQAFLRTMIGEVRYAAGEIVLLMPATAYTRELVSDTTTAPSNLDPRLKQYGPQTQADGEGKFEFTDLPPCTYIVITQVYWQVPSGYSSFTQGGVVRKEVTAVDGKTVKAILTR